jgi:ferredoxin-NADP reductase
VKALARPGFRRFRIVRKTTESRVITSFDLVHADGSALPPFEPGQFLTVRVDPQDEAAGTRHYSLSGDPAATASYRISVKRESAPAARPDLPPGRMSSHLHEGVVVGDELVARGPEGHFVLDRASRRPVVLLAGGVGVTPLLAMAHALAAEGIRRTVLVHATEGRDVQAFGSELRELAARSPNLTVHMLYRTVTAQDVAGVHHDGEGLLDKAVLQRLLPLDDYDVYLCGPTPFMQANYTLLTDLGIRDERVRHEFFGPATVLKTQRPTEPAVTAVPLQAPASPEAGGGASMVSFARSGTTAAWNDDAGTLLDFAEAQGLAPDFSCRAGICQTCVCRLVAGDVDYVTEPLDQPPAGTALLCCSRPLGSITLDL